MVGIVSNVVGDKGFGFILCGKNEFFFHKSGFMGNWHELVADYLDKRKIEVEFEKSESPKGPRAENVRRKGEIR